MKKKRKKIAKNKKMKVFIVSGQQYGRKNIRLHHGMLNELSNFCNMTMVSYRSFRLNPLQTMKDFNPDVLLLYNCAKRDLYVPDGKYKKVLIDVDVSFKSPKKVIKYINRNKINLCIERGAFEDKRFLCPMVWLPFSADENEFIPKDMEEKENIVGLSATYLKFQYKQRQKMVNLLKKQNLIKVFGCSGTKYVKFLSNISVGITSTDIGDNIQFTPRGKMWEYMASKTVVLTTPFKGLQEIFGENYEDYICVCNQDLSDLKDKASFLLNNKEERKKLVENSYRLFLEHHTHKKRAEELYNILLALKNGNKIPKKWGI